MKVGAVNSDAGTRDIKLNCLGETLFGTVVYDDYDDDVNLHTLVS